MTGTDSGVPQGEPRLLIDGKLVESSSGATFDNLNPATEQVLGPVADATAADMDTAIAAARRAFDDTDWSTNHALRKQCLLQLQAALEEERELIRVVGAITPWNYPFEIIVNKLGQALATGNTVVLKPAPDTPWSATRICRLIAERTDIPAGVVKVVTSADHLLGEQLVEDPRVDAISFTGSTATGRRIMAHGAESLKRLFLELGGKSASIYLDDADFSGLAMAWAGACTHAGQGCAMQTRLLLPRSRYDEGVELVAEGFKTVTYGDPTDPNNFMGPLISAKQRDRVLGYMQKGQDEGARLVLGGGRPAHLDKGYYVEPTLFADVDNSMTIAQEEIFGPVLVLIPFDDDDDAVRIANDSHYGLSGGVTAGTEERALSVARRIRTGTIGVNGGIWYGADSPFGGYKASGIGRQNGLEGFEQYLETKTYAGPLA